MKTDQMPLNSGFGAETTAEEVAGFQPRVKRQLDIAPIIGELSDGMA